MSSFWWNIDGEPVEIVFSLCKNGRWMSSGSGIFFDYLEHEDIAIANSELEDLGEDVSQMLLQVLNLETT